MSGPYAAPVPQDIHEQHTRPLTSRRTRAGTVVSEPAVVMGRYRLAKRLGSGAFGTVWSARDERLDRDVAVKLLPRERVNHARFEREARAAARLQHPAIVTLYEAAVDDEGAYLVSELVRGKTLDALLDQGKLSDQEILQVGISLCDALSHAHDQGVIHRDVKPSNVLVPTRVTGSGDRAKLTDFGVAHVAGGDSLTRTGDVIGTLAYMAPEQADGRDVGPEADLYALALVLYEALSGVNPQATGRRRSNFIPPLRRQRRDLPRDLADGLDLALRPRPSERGTVTDLRVTLANSLGLADDTRGVVAGWRGQEVDDTWVQDEAGPEWRDDPAPRLHGRRAGAAGVVGVVGGSKSSSTAIALGAGAPRWLPRVVGGLGAGLAVAWIVTHLMRSTPIAPAVIALIAAGVALLLPRVGLLLAAVPLAGVGLAGAFPALVAQFGRRWWQRALIGAAGFVLITVVAALVGHNLYWLPARFATGHRFHGSPTGFFEHVLTPLSRQRGFEGAAVWAVAATVQPWLRVRQFPMFDLLLAAAWSAVVVAAVEAVGAAPLHGDVIGALVGTLIIAWQPLQTLVEETRHSAGIHTDVA
jgi:eukaryotic-like serine/threonine-protein kinase